MKKRKTKKQIILSPVYSFRPYQKIYKLVHDGFVNYVTVTDDHKYLEVNYGPLKQVYSLDGSSVNDIPEKRKKKETKMHKFVYKVPRLFDLQNAKKNISEINSVLCPGLRLVLDYDYLLKGEVSTYQYNIRQPYDLKLCLYDLNSNNCVSSIKYDFKNTDVYITSNTNPAFEGRKYNKLLRAVSIVVSRIIYPEATKLLSIPFNIVSLYLLIHYYHAKFKDEKIQILLEKDNENLTKNGLKNFVKDNDIDLEKQTLTIDLLNENTMNTIKETIPKILEEIICI